MPVYDTVIGARLDTSAVDAAERANAEELFEGAASNDGDLAASDRQRALDDVRAIRGVKAELVIEGEEGGRYLLVIERGEEHAFELHDSRRGDRVEAPLGTSEPAIHSKVPIDDVLDVLREAGVEDAHASSDHATTLPYRWPDRTQMMTALAAIGPLLADKTVRALVEIDGCRFDVELADARVTSTPLFVVAAPPELTARATAIADLAPRGKLATVPYAKPASPSPTLAYDPERPMSTGTLSQREAAWYERTNYWRTKGVVDLAPIIAAVRDDANRDRRYAELRRQMYHYLAKHDTPEVRDVFLWALREEDDETAGTVTYIGWRLEQLIAELPVHMREAEARGDKRTLRRMKKLKSEAK